MWIVLGIFIFWCLVFILTSLRERRIRLLCMRALDKHFSQIQKIADQPKFVTELAEFSEEDEVSDDQVDAIATAITASILNRSTLNKPAFKILKEKTDD